MLVNRLLVLSLLTSFVVSCSSVSTLPLEDNASTVTIQAKKSTIDSLIQAEIKKYAVAKKPLKNSTRGTTTGIIKYHNLKTSTLKSGNREMVVYLPPSYQSNPSKKYPVMYMHDGQNIFDKVTGAFGKEWYVDEKIEYLIQKNVSEEVIIVGVYNGLGERINEYTPTSNPEYGGGDGKKYLDFLAKEVKPFIDKTYRTKADKQNTAVGGSSLGGLISFYAGVYYPEVFGKIAIMSPSFWWNDGECLKYADQIKANTNVWLDAGTKEGSDPSVLINLVTQMSKLIEPKVGKDNLVTYFQPEAEHNEEAWAIRIHGPLIQFFGKEANNQKKVALIKRLMTYEEWSKL